MKKSSASLGALLFCVGAGGRLDGSIPEGACRFAAEGHMASIGPSALGAKGYGRCRGGGKGLGVRK